MTSLVIHLSYIFIVIRWLADNGATYCWYIHLLRLHLYRRVPTSCHDVYIMCLCIFSCGRSSLNYSLQCVFNRSCSIMYLIYSSDVPPLTCSSVGYFQRGWYWSSWNWCYIKREGSLYNHSWDLCLSEALIHPVLSMSVVCFDYLSSI